MPVTPVVIGLGELLWDCFPTERRSGGAPANVAFQASQLGCAGTICSRVGDDTDGRELTESIRARGLDVSSIQSDTRYPTGTVTVDVSRENHPEYTIHEDVAWDFLECTPEWNTLMRSAAAVCFGSLAQRSPTSRLTIQSCLEACPNDCLIVFDVNLRQHYYSREVLESSLALANTVKLNSDELQTIAELLNLDSVPTQFARELSTRFEIELVCLTRGADGCQLITPATSVEQPGVKVDVVDAVGAGDAFTAGLIYVLLNEYPLDRAAQFANQIGALVASRAGAMPDLKAEFRELIAQFENENRD